MPHMSAEFRFTIMGVLGGDKPRTIVRYTCDHCPAFHDQTIHAGKNLNPEMLAKRAARDGWKVPGRRAGKVVCPACQALRAEKAKGDSPKVVALRPLAMPPPTIFDPQQQEMPMTAPAKTTTPLVTELTPDQKVKVRSFLDRHFDDAVGAFLDGWSDQKIGTEVGVPWALVAKLRDVAYGPIRVDPEITALRVQIADFDRKLKEHGDTWRRAMDKAEQEILGLKAQLASLEKKRAA